MEIHDEGIARQREKKLGDQFDIRLFHDEILRHGAVPLDILERQVKTWLTRQAAK